MDIRGIMRRVAVGNLEGARKVVLQNPPSHDELARYEENCICAKEGKPAVRIQEIIDYLQGEKA